MQKGFALLWLILVLVAITAVGTGAYYLGKSKSTQPTPAPFYPAPTSSPTSLPPEKNLSTTNDSFSQNSGWKEYSDSQVSFKYPASWNTIGSSHTSGVLITPSDLSTLQRGGGKWDTILVGEDPNIRDEHKTDSTKTVISKNVTINSLAGIEYTTTYSVDFHGINKGASFVNTVLENKGKRYRIELLDPTYKDTYYQLLSTFKFTSP